MRNGLWIVLAVCAVLANGAMAQDQSVYAPPSPPRADEGVNEGGVNLDFAFRYLTDYVYRGVSHNKTSGREDAPNLQFDGTLSFNLGQLPHPFGGILANVNDSDQVSRFQEFRPIVGFDWNVKPFTFSIGHTTYIYPEREQFNTSEFWGMIAFDDSSIFNTDKPVFSPYLLTAYDYDLNNGVYMELGIKHDFVIEDTPISLTPFADIAYISGIQQQFVFTSPGKYGFQHYDLGLIARYSLNTLFNFSRRFGEIDLTGYLTYTGDIDTDVLAHPTLWGGAGITFKY